MDDLHQVVYIKVKPNSKTQNGDQEIIYPTSDSAGSTAIESLHYHCTCISLISPLSLTVSAVPPAEPVTDTCSQPLTTEQLFSFLLPHVSKWQSLGEALSLDEDRLDEIYTNNERDEDSLQEILELYMMRSDLDHSWENIQAALEKIKISSELLTKPYYVLVRNDCTWAPSSVVISLLHHLLIMPYPLSLCTCTCCVSVIDC